MALLLQKRWGSASVVLAGQMRHLFEPEAVEPYAYTGPRLSTDALGSAGLLTDTIAAEFGAGAVDLYLCADKPNAQRLRGTSFGALLPTMVWEHTTKAKGHQGQWERLRLCYEALEAHLAPQGGVRAVYRWVVRSRFDTVFFAPVPALGV